MKLSERMLEAPNVPGKVRNQYYAQFLNSLK
jgi:hypothetical protein